MKLTEINALRSLDWDGLVDEARRLGISIAELSEPDHPSGRRLLLTRDGIRLKIIDAVCAREVQEETPTKEMEQDDG